MLLPELSSDFKQTHTMLFNAYLPEVLRTAVDLGVFDLLESGPMGLTKIAAELGSNVGMTDALLEILCERAYLVRTESDYALSPVSREFFLSSSPACQGKIMAAMANMSQLMGSAREIMTNGGAVHNDRMWASPEMMETMLQGSRAGKIQDAVAFVSALPEFPAMRRMLDVAGSFGYFAMGILDRSEALSAVVCDLPEVAEMAAPYIEKEGYRLRLEAMGIDMEAGEDFGTGYDLVFVSNYLYAWSEDHRLVDFLKRVRAALNPGGVFVSRHMTLDVVGEDRHGQLIMEYATRLGGYPTHAISEARLTEALTEAGFSDFTIQRPESVSYDNTLTVAARVAS